MRVKQGGEPSALRGRTAFLLGLLVAATFCAHDGFAASQGQEATAGESSSVRVMAEIDDPQLGTRWLLRSNPTHPGGPGVMTPATYTKGVIPNSSSTAVSAQPVIRGGDRIIVEENLAVVEARLEAIALGSAAAGSSFQARLRIGGKVVRAIALRPGRAMLGLESKVQR